jgi:uncharacterized phage protein gp47/JayE
MSCCVASQETPLSSPARLLAPQLQRHPQAEVAKVEAVTPYKEQMVTLQAQLEDLERHAETQLQERHYEAQRTLHEQLSSVSISHTDELRNTERRLGEQVRAILAHHYTHENAATHARGSVHAGMCSMKGRGGRQNRSRIHKNLISVTHAASWSAAVG